MATHNDFLSAVAHRRRCVSLPKHSSWLNQIEILFGILHRQLLGGHCASVADLEAQVRHFLDYSNRTMAHPFAWTSTGKPIQKRRRASFGAPHRWRSLGKSQRLTKPNLPCRAV